MQSFQYHVDGNVNNCTLIIGSIRILFMNILLKSIPLNTQDFFTRIQFLYRFSRKIHLIFAKSIKCTSVKNNVIRREGATLPALFLSK